MEMSVIRGFRLLDLSDSDADGDLPRPRYPSPLTARVSPSSSALAQLHLHHHSTEATGPPLAQIHINDVTRTSRKSCIATTDAGTSILLVFSKADEIDVLRTALDKLKAAQRESVFCERTEEASALQYFQFYGYLSQQQNMMQDYIRTSTYQRAILANTDDFKDKIVLDVGAGSGILSFFAVQAGARRVYAVEASSMAQHAETLVHANKLSERIVVIAGKIEEITIPEPVDVILSEPMGYMLFNERMLETFLHAKKWLSPNGRMFPTSGDLHIAPFTDDALYMEQFSKANFWFQTCFHGIDLTACKDASVQEYFGQPIVDTFDIRICMAKSQRFTVDFQKAEEQQLHRIEIPLEFYLRESGTVHGLAFWFDVAFTGSTQTIWLSTAPTEPLTHWYQVRCLLETPMFVKQGQTLGGKVLLIANKKQSYDVEMELVVEGTGACSSNTLDLKNPYFRYNGQAPQPPPGHNTQSPSELYWGMLDPASTNSATRQVPTMNGIATNGLDDITLSQNLSGAYVQTNDTLCQQRAAQARISANMPATSLGGGVSPSLFTQQQQAIVLGNTSHYPISNNFMIGDYVTPGNIILPTQGLATYRQ